MPSQKPRVALTLEPELSGALAELADAMDVPLSKAIVWLLTSALPSIEGTTKMLRAVNAGNKAAAKRALTHMVGDAAAQMMGASQPELFAKPRRKS